MRSLKAGAVWEPLHLARSRIAKTITKPTFFGVLAISANLQKMGKPGVTSSDKNKGIFSINQI